MGHSRCNTGAAAAGMGWCAGLARYHSIRDIRRRRGASACLVLQRPGPAGLFGYVF